MFVICLLFFGLLKFKVFLETEQPFSDTVQEIKANLDKTSSEIIPSDEKMQEINIFLLDADNKKIGAQVVLSSYSAPNEPTEAVVTLEETPVRQIVFEDATPETIDRLRVDEIEEREQTETNFEQMYAIDPTEVEFTKAEAKVTAKANTVFKCAEWDFENQECLGEWKEIMSVIPGHEYSLEITPNDPAYGEINITSAMQLNSKRLPIADVYSEVRYRDDVWKTIPQNNYVRVTFAENLTSDKDITIYAKSFELGAVEVYEKDSTVKIADFGALGLMEKHVISLENLEGMQDTFDLKIVNGDVDFDQIVDPIALPGDYGGAYDVDLRAQSCEQGFTAKNEYEFGESCDGTYPAACTADLLSCDEGSIETAAETTSLYYVGVHTTHNQSSVADCGQINKVLVCYEWWASKTAVADCSIAVDAAGDGSYTAATTTCPGTSANPGMTCQDVTSIGETFTCETFFGSSATKAHAVASYQRTGTPGATMSVDVLFYNVSYTAGDFTPPTWNETPGSKVVEYGYPFYWDINASDDATGGSGISAYWINDTINFQMDRGTGVIQNATNKHLLDGNIYAVNISVNDTAKNTLSKVVNIQATTPTSPQISDINLYSLGNDSVMVNWTTDSLSNGTVRYGETVSLGNLSVNASLRSTNIVYVSGLTSQTFYYYNVTSCTFSLCNTSGPYSFTTAATPVPELFVDSVEYLHLVIPSDATSASVNLGKSQNISNVVPFITWSILDAGGDVVQKYLPDVLISPTEITMSRTSGADTTLDAQIELVEFEPTLVKVQSGTFLVPVGSASATASIPTTLTKPENTALIFYWNTSESSDDWDNSMVMGQITNENTLTFSVYSTGTVGAKAGHWWVFESLNNSFTVQNRTLDLIATAASGTATINSVQMNKTMLISSWTAAEADDDPRDAFYDINLTDATTITASRLGSPSGTIYGIVQAITIQGDAFVQRGSFAAAATVASGSTTITAIDLNRSMVHSPTKGKMASDGTATAGAGAFMNLNLTATNTISWVRDETTGAVRGSWEVIQWNLTGGTASLSITNVKNQSISNESAVINWTTSAAANGSINYGTTVALGTSIANATSLTYHNQNVTGLLNYTTYYYNITSCDASGTCTKSGGWVFTTLQNLDIISPYFLQTLTNQAFEYGTLFQYDVNATDVVDFANYTINDTINFRINESGMMENLTLTPIGVFRVNVTINDSSNNKNQSTITITVTDTKAPTWNQTLTNQAIEYGDAFIYQVNATDLLFDVYSINDTLHFNITSTTGILTNKSLLPLGALVLNITVNDTTNNRNSSIITITTSDTKPPTWNQTLTNLAAEYGTAFLYQVNATDLLFDVYSINDTLHFNITRTTGVITNKSILPLGALILNITTNDTSNNRNSSVITITTSDTTPPTWNETLTNQAREYGAAFIYDVNASDLLFDVYSINDTLHFTIDKSTGLITNKTDTLIPVGTYALNITANDTTNNRNSTIITVTITDTTPPFWNQTLTNQAREYGAAFLYQVNATDLLFDVYSINDTLHFNITRTTGVITNKS
ncbi:fibronectin type III domain-containing protein, partial [Candidatus Woesearchaeota archaeon]|nr:fibronectin type III domain-containing protein [Candidatus Woesearchaeota archaeon]